MGLFSSLCKVYDLDTLDTRFTSSPSVPYRTIIESRSDPLQIQNAAEKTRGRAPAARWQTSEFYIYYLVIALAVPYMFWVAYDVSRPSDPRYAKYERFLTDGWIPGRKIDVSDAQYQIFRGNLPYMAALLLLHPLLRRVCNIFQQGTGRERNADGTSRLQQRASFDSAFAIFYLICLHGISAFKIFGILWLNYRIATRLPRRLIPMVTWVFNVSILFANELCEGYPLKKLAASFAPSSSTLVSSAAWLDRYGGLVSRWEVLFNITILRLISFNMDRYWSVDKRSSSSVEKKQLDPSNLSERERIVIAANEGDYCFRNYLAYAIYAPLYLAGPIITFNDYISQSKHRSASIEQARIFRYGVRFVLVLLSMELILHYDYVGAISKASPVWSDYSAAQLSLLSFFNLHIIWLKLLLPWRLFRLWALVDGIDPPENMVRCVSNNYSTQLFWRAWHRSYNRWLIRYIYIPLGGSSFRNWQVATQSVVTYLLVFTFVALWHDIQMRLLIWGWLIVLFMVPEWTASYMFPQQKWEPWPTAYRMLCCGGAVGNVLLMMSANLVGFAVGLDGLESIVKGILRDWSGVLFLSTACSCLFVGVQIMFEIREAERRKGVTLKC